MPNAACAAELGGHDSYAKLRAAAEMLALRSSEASATTHREDQEEPRVTAKLRQRKCSRFAAQGFCGLSQREDQEEPKSDSIVVAACIWQGHCALVHCLTAHGTHTHRNGTRLPSARLMTIILDLDWRATRAHTLTPAHRHRHSARFAWLVTLITIAGS